MWDLKDIALALAALIGTTGGIGALLRARGQNRVDLRAQFAAEHAAIKADLRLEIADLKTDMGKLEEKLAASEKREEQFAEQQRQNMERIAGLTQQNVDQQAQIQALQAQNQTQASEIATLRFQNEQITGEKAKAIHDAQVALSTMQFLERENAELRRECERLRAKLPQRTEVP